MGLWVNSFCRDWCRFQNMCFSACWNCTQGGILRKLLWCSFRKMMDTSYTLSCCFQWHFQTRSCMLHRSQMSPPCTQCSQGDIVYMRSWQPKSSQTCIWYIVWNCSSSHSWRDRRGRFFSCRIRWFGCWGKIPIYRLYTWFRTYLCRFDSWDGIRDKFVCFFSSIGQLGMWNILSDCLSYKFRKVPYIWRTWKCP